MTSLCFNFFESSQPLWSKDFYVLHFTGGETEAQRDQTRGDRETEFETETSPRVADYTFGVKD